MAGPLKTLPALTSPRTLGFEIQSLIMANPDTTFLIRRDGEVITLWSVDNEHDEPKP